MGTEDGHWKLLKPVTPSIKNAAEATGTAKAPGCFLHRCNLPLPVTIHSGELWPKENRKPIVVSVSTKSK